MVMDICTYFIIECPDGYLSQAEINQLFSPSTLQICLRDPDVFNPSNYKEYYVDPSDSPLSNGSGTSSDPFMSLYFAFTKIYATFTKILLSAGDYLYQIDTSLVTPLIMNKYDPLNINSMLEYYELWIIGDPISMSVIFWKEKLVISSKAYKTFVQNIIFKGDQILLSNCTGDSDYCYYCPVLTIADSIITTDQGNELTEEDYYNIPTNCSAYNDHILFSFKHSAFFENVEFSGFRQQFNSLIYSELSLNLTNVNFTKNQAMPGGSVINLLCLMNCDKANFGYAGGLVTDLNYGYEHSRFIEVGNFLSSSNLNSLLFESISFTYNFVLNYIESALPAHLISIINNSGTIVISDCTFNANYVNQLITVDQRSLLYNDLRPNSLNVSEAYSQTHFTLINTNFYNVYSSIGCITYLMKNILHNINVYNVSIYNISLGSDGILNIVNYGKITERETIGSDITVITNKIAQTIWIPKRTVKIELVSIDTIACSSTVINIKGVAKLVTNFINLSDVQSSYSGEIAPIIQLFIDAGKYLSIVPSADELSCGACLIVFSIEDIYSLSAYLVNIYSMYFYHAPSGRVLVIDTVSSDSTINSLTMQNIYLCSWQTSGVLSISNLSGRLNLFSPLLQDLQSPNGVVTELINISNLKIINLVGYDLEAGAVSTLYILGVENLLIDNFSISTAYTYNGDGACLSIISNNKANTPSSITLSEGMLNSCSSDTFGGCIAFDSLESTDKQSINLLNTFFEYCYGPYIGSINIGYGIALVGRSLFSHITMCNCNTQQMAMITDYHSSGLLKLKDIQLYNNFGKWGGMIGTYPTRDSVYETLVQISNYDCSNTTSRYEALQFNSLSEYTQIELNNITIHDNTFAPGLAAAGIYLVRVTCTLNELHAWNLANTIRIVSSTNLTISNSAFVNLSYWLIDISGNCTFTCIACEFSYCTQPIMFAMSNSTISLINSQFYNNNQTLTLQDSGLMMISMGGTRSSYLINTTFTNNTSIRALINSYKTATFIESCAFTNNIIQRSTELVIFIDHSQVYISNSIFIQEGPQLILCGFISVNQASLLQIASSTFSGGTNALGGALSILQSTLIIDSSQFEYNTGTTSGGSIYSTASTITISRTRFYFGQSALGDEIYCDNLSRLILSTCSFLYSQTLGTSSSSSVYVLESSYVSVENSLFSSSSDNISGLIAWGTPSVTISNSIFKNIRSLSYGALGCINHSNNGIVTITNSTFIDNYSLSTGAGVYIENMGLIMDNCIITKNTARLDGGGMYLITPVCTNCIFNISGKSSFTNNTSGGYGGAIKWQDYKPNIDATVLVGNNTSLYGGDLASIPISLKISSRRSLTDSPDFIIFSAAPGQQYSKIINISIYDYYDNVVVTDSTSTLNIQKQESYPELSLKGQVSFIAVKGVFSLTGIIPGGPPGSTQRLTATIDSISSLNVQSNNVNSIDSITIEIFLRNCTNGEQISASECTECKENTYLIEPSKACNSCPVGGICTGGSTILPSAGYWRSSNLSEIVYPCPLRQACTGNTTGYDYAGGCIKGYYGIMCSSCIGGYRKLSDGSCGVCPSQSTNIIVSISIAIVILIICIVLVRFSLTSAFSPKAVHSVYLKILTNYVQLMFLTAQFEFNWPAYVIQLLSFQKQLMSTTDSIFSIDCYVASRLNEDPTQRYYYKLLSTLFLPIIIFSISFLIWLGVCFTRETYSYLKRELFLTMIIVFFLMHPNISIVCLSHFECQDIDKIGSFLKVDYEIECGTREYIQKYFLLVIPSIVVWVAGLPVLILIIMIKRRNTLYQDHNRVIFGFLFNGFKNYRFYWEFLIIYRKIAIILAIVFLSSVNSTVQALSIFLLMNFSIFIHHKLQPYISEELNNMEFHSLAISAITIYCGLLYLSDTANSLLEFILFLLIIIANIYFLLHWCYWITQALLEIAAKLSPRLRYFLKKGDDYDIEFYQNPISIKGSYNEKHTGTRLHTFLNKGVEKSTEAFNIKNNNDLFLKILEAESNKKNQEETRKKNNLKGTLAP